MTPRRLTVRQAAERLARSPRTIQAWIRAGELPATWVGDGYRIAESDLAALVECVHPGAKDGLGSRLRTRPDTALSTHRYADSIDADPVAAESHPPAEDPMPDLSEYLQLSEAAEHIGRSTRTVRRWVQCGDLPRTRRVKARLYIHPADLDAMFAPANPDAFAAWAS